MACCRVELYTGLGARELFRGVGREQRLKTDCIILQSKLASLLVDLHFP
jgi:hypothetical protein